MNRKLMMCLSVAPLFFGIAREARVPFTSTRYHYTVTYPSSWHVCEPSLPNLELCNFSWQNRVQGVVIPRDGAMISVVGAPAGVSTVRDWVLHDAVVEDKVVLDKTSKVLKPPAAGCTTLRERVVDAEVGPNVYQRFTTIYCATSRGVFVVALNNWKGDPAQDNYRTIALDIAHSLQAIEVNE